MQKLKTVLLATVVATLSALYPLPGGAQVLGPSVVEPSASAAPTAKPSEGSDSSGSGVGDLNIMVTRLAGNDRYATATEITNHLYKDQSVEEVIIASGEQFPDAITSANFSSSNAPTPVLLTPSKALTKEVKDELLRIAKPKAKVLLVGGDKAIDPEIAKDLSEQGFSVSRIAGHERQGTSIEVANRAHLRARSGYSVVTPAEDFALGVFGASLAVQTDSLHVIAYENHLLQGPILDWFAKEKSKRVTVLGDRIDFSLRGSSYEVVRSNAPEQIPSVTCYPKTGCTESADIQPAASPQQTIVENMLVRHFGQAKNFVLVAADKPVDGIAATQLAAKLNAPILPIEPKTLRRYLGVIKHLGKADRNFYLIGGESAIEKGVVEEISKEMTR